MLIREVPDSEEKLFPFKMLRAAFIYLTLFSIVTPLYKLYVQLPNFETLDSFSGNLLNYYSIDDESLYKMKLSNRKDELTLTLLSEYMTPPLQDALDEGGEFTILFKRDIWLSLNAYQVEHQNKVVLDYVDIVQVRKNRALWYKEQAFIFGPVCFALALLSQLVITCLSRRTLAT